MYLAAKFISDGSEDLLEILGPGIVGGLIVPILSSLPDALDIIGYASFSKKYQSLYLIEYMWISYIFAIIYSFRNQGKQRSCSGLSVSWNGIACWINNYCSNNSMGGLYCGWQV